MKYFIWFVIIYASLVIILTSQFGAFLALKWHQIKQWMMNPPPTKSQILLERTRRILRENEGPLGYCHWDGYQMVITLSDKTLVFSLSGAMQWSREFVTKVTGISFEEYNVSNAFNEACRLLIVQREG